MEQYPKRLIEVDLPIREISRHSRREKSIRHGHISTLHIWWARRPLAACRAVICAALWPDPADELCPPAFREAVARILPTFAEQVRTDRKLAELSTVGWSRWNRLTEASWQADHMGSWADMRYALLDYIADFANWDASKIPAFLETSRQLTQAAHEALGGLPGTRPLVVDPFAGGGAIPLEALRVGADAFASDLNPVAVLLNKVVLEYIPKYGQQLADEVRKWGKWVKKHAEQELAEFYPIDPDGGIPIAYIWARTITCEGPGCGAEVPLLRSLWLSKRKNRGVALDLIPNEAENRVEFQVVENPLSQKVHNGTIQRSAATCPLCGYTTPASNVRGQFAERHGGSKDARLVAVVMTYPERKGKFYRVATKRDETAFIRATEYLQERCEQHEGAFSLLPEEELPYLRSIFNIKLLGVNSWSDLFTPRQLLVISTLVEQIKLLAEQREAIGVDIWPAVQTCLALAVDRHIDQQSTLVTWIPNIQAVSHTFVRQALGICWDFVEPNPLADGGGSLDGAVRWVVKVLENEGKFPTVGTGQSQIASATEHPLPDNVASLISTDPPYYDAVPYADLSDYFYVWLKRMLAETHPALFSEELTAKLGEIVQLAERNKSYSYKTRLYFENQMTIALDDAKRVSSPNGLGIIVFAHKETSAWETMLASVVNANWVVVASWPIDTERTVRLRARNSAALGSSIHLVCRPREIDEVGDWRDVLQQVPARIREWLPRLANEGIVGADAIFACLGPALEIFSRYSSVERADGSEVPLGEYLEYVWAAVSKEALNMVFAGADTTGFEADARLTAMWLWTLNANTEEQAKSNGKTVASTGYLLEYDAARKIAQGLGAHLEQLGNLVEIKGSKARLLPVAERTQALFGKEGVQGTRRKKRPSGPQQLSLLSQLPEEEIAELHVEESAIAEVGNTVLDRVHQSMLLFGAGQSEALKRFLVEDGIGRNERFWRLAQALSALYPAVTDEKRWVDGVLARKKGLGLA